MYAYSLLNGLETGAKGGVLLVLGLFMTLPGLPVPVDAQETDLETPTSSGRVAQVETPILRIPKLDTPPTIDGPMKEGEWQGASALSGFWYDFAQAKFLYLAPDETQVEVYGAYDDENLYLAYRSPVYPQGSWLKARGRYPDTTHHPRYGLIWDDHVELEIRPFPDNTKGFELGLFKWFVNPTGTIADQYWSKQGGMQGKYNSKVKVRNEVNKNLWTLELKIPLEQLTFGLYGGKNKQGEKYVKVPPPPETAYRVWFTRGIGGNGAFFNVFDKHVWNTTKTKLILDPDTVSFQINELGAVMEDRINVEITVKNHSDRSRTMRLGFFVESAAGTIYSSYNSSDLENGLLELVPGEVKKIRLQKAFPGMTTSGNSLWFDVRQAGTPAKSLFRTRLIDFHAKSADMIPEDGDDFRSRRMDVIAEELRPSRKEFELMYDYSKFKNRVAGFVDVGIRGATDKIDRAVEAKLSVLNTDKGGTVVAETRADINGNFATFIMDLPELTYDHTYTMNVLLFNENKRIVGEKKKGEFGPGRYMPHVYQSEGDLENHPGLDPVKEWLNNDLGMSDIVWEPFTEMKVLDGGFETLKHRFTVADSGLPEQIYIKPNERDLPLEARNGGEDLSTQTLQWLGRGPQLRNPMRLVVRAGGEKHVATVQEEAELVKEWDSELVYRSELKAGPLNLTLKTRYDCDGSMHCTLTYGPGGEATVDGFHLVSDFDGAIDLLTSGKKGAGMAGADVFTSTLPHNTGVVWDSANVEKPDLFYSHFVPFLFFGSGDRGFSWYAPSDKNWELDRNGSSMFLSRNENGDVTWQVNFVNHTTTLNEQQTLEFHMLTHPAKPKPDGYRRYAWLYRGDTWAAEYPGPPVATFTQGREPTPNTQREKDTVGPWERYYRLRHVGVAPNMDRRFEQRGVYYFARQIRAGRNGWWWDESWPASGRTANVAEGDAYFREPENVGPKEIPWQPVWTFQNMRRTQKRLARLFKKNNVAQRNYHWANHAATFYESFAWDTQLVEGAGAAHRSYEIDTITNYPNSLWRYQAHHFTGLVARVVADANPSRPGDDKRFDRQWLGRALLNDIGVNYSGPHGDVQHVEQGLGLINELEAFGYFKEKNTEFLPYWRNGDIVRLGEGRRKDAHLDPPAEQEPKDHLYVTAFRRPMEKDGKSGYHVLFVLMNEYTEPIRTNLHILNPGRLFGDGANNDLRADADVSSLSVPETLRDELKTWAGEMDGTPALKDLERDGVVTGEIGEDKETYGPIWIPRHNYRVVYGYSVTGDTVETQSE